MTSVYYKFLERFNHVYNFLYDLEGSGKVPDGQMPGYDEAMEAGERAFKEHPDFMRDLENARGDMFFSDRELAALGYTLWDFAGRIY